MKKNIKLRQLLGGNENENNNNTHNIQDNNNEMIEKHEAIFTTEILVLLTKLNKDFETYGSFLSNFNTNVNSSINNINAKLTSHSNILTRNDKELKNKLNEFTNKNTQLTEENNKLKLNITTNETDLQKVTETLNKLQLELSNTENTNTQEITRLKNEIEKHKEMKDNLNKEISDLKIEFEKNQNNIKRLNEQISKIKTTTINNIAVINNFTSFLKKNKNNINFTSLLTDDLPDIFKSESVINLINDFKENEKAEQERLAAEKAEQERIAAEKAKQERIAAEKAEQERIAAEQAEQERLAAEKAEQERIAAEQAEKAKQSIQFNPRQIIETNYKNIMYLYQLWTYFNDVEKQKTFSDDKDYIKISTYIFENNNILSIDNITLSNDTIIPPNTNNELKKDIKFVFGLYNINKDITLQQNKIDEINKFLSNINTLINDELFTDKNGIDKSLDMREKFFKIPGIIAKVIDPISGGDITRIQNADEYVKLIGDTCIQVGGKCTNGETSTFGPFRKCVGPSSDGEVDNPTNEDIWEYLISSVSEGGYGLEELLKQSGKDIKLYGYGFSGSGKTYTLLQGRAEDPSILSHLITYIKDNKNLEFKNPPVKIKIFYPKEDNDNNTDNFYYETQPQLKNAIGDAETQLQSLIKSDNYNAEALKKQLERLERILNDYLLVMPTSNNPNSSRAFTIIEILLENGTKVTFIDLPGLEKKVDMIRDVFLPGKDAETIKHLIKNKIVNKPIQITNLPSMDNTDTHKSLLKITEFSISTGELYKITEYKDRQKISIVFIDDDYINNLNNNDVDKENKEHNYLLLLLKVILGINAASFPRSISNLGEVLNKYLIKVLCYLNYQIKIIKNYTYTIDVNTFIGIINNFTITYHQEMNESNREQEIIAESGNFFANDYINIINEIYNGFTFANFRGFGNNLVKTFKYNAKANEEGLYSNKGILVVDAFINYSSRYYANNILLLCVYVEFLLEQGAPIVTSLEHLLFEFLNQIPGGIASYNNSVNDKTKKFQITENEKGVITGYANSEYTEESKSSGMMETVYRKYLPGMHKILGITDKSRFINLLAIRRPENNDDAPKRCVGAIDTLEFGATLVQSNSANCPVVVKGGYTKRNLKTLIKNRKRSHKL